MRRRTKTAAARRIVVALLKFGAPLAIIAWLVANIDPAQWRQLRSRTVDARDWLLLELAFGATMTALCITMIRWWLLVRALEIPFRLRDAFRLGFLAFLLNFVSVGSVGGDLFKAFFIAREQPGRRAEAAATVLVDRIVGFCGLLAVATAALLLVDLPEEVPALAAMRKLTYFAAAAGGVFLLLLLTPPFSSGNVSNLAAGLPKLGPTLERLAAAVRMYRSRLDILMACGVLSVLVHSLLAVNFFLLAHALFDPAPTLAEHFIISPLASVAAALPFTPAGLGAFEAAMEYLYLHVPEPLRTGASGVTIALAYRMVTILCAMVGAVIYWTSRKEVRRVMKEAEEEMRRE